MAWATSCSRIWWISSSSYRDGEVSRHRDVLRRVVAQARALLGVVEAEAPHAGIEVQDDERLGPPSHPFEIRHGMRIDPRHPRAGGGDGPRTGQRRGARFRASGAPRHAGASRTRYSRSSPARRRAPPVGVVAMNHSSPSGPAVTSRSRPSSPTNHGVAVSGAARRGRSDRPQPLAAEGRQEQGVADDREPARARLGGRPLRDGVDEARVAGLALDDRPSVVRAAGDAVQLVPRVLPELRRPQVSRGVPRDPLRIAVPERPGEVVERVARCRAPVGRHPQDLARQRRGILRGVLVARIAGRRVEEPVGAERDPPAVVVAGLAGCRSARPRARRGRGSRVRP